MKKILLLCLIATTIFFTGCRNDEVKKINSFDDLKTARIGVLPGTKYEIDAKKFFPDATYLYLDSLGSFMQSLDAGKIDAFVVGRAHYNALINEGVKVSCLEKTVGKVEFAFFFPKDFNGSNLATQMNLFLKNLKDSGELDKLKTKWFGAESFERSFKKSELDGANGTLRMGTPANAVPFIYFERGEVNGYEAELFDKFCAAYGYNYEVKVKNFQGILFDLKTNELEIAADGTEILDSRKDTLIFSDPHYSDEEVVVIKDYSSGNENFLTDIKNQFVRSLIEENRWEMIVEGVGITILIIALPTIFSTLLGFLLYLIYRKQYKLFNKIIDFLCTLLIGLPTIVILLIFYYVIFGSVDINGIIVVIIAFSILSSLNIMLILKGGEKTIPKGQFEAATALGFSERQAFVKFILPQIAQNFFPHYQNIILGFMRGTAIVGYVSVQDLTRMADLIRSRTFDAFVPLLIVSVIYFILSRLIIKVTDIFLKYINPKNRSREDILKDVKL